MSRCVFERDDSIVGPVSVYVSEEDDRRYKWGRTVRAWFGGDARTRAEAGAVVGSTGLDLGFRFRVCPMHGEGTIGFSCWIPGVHAHASFDAPKTWFARACDWLVRIEPSDVHPNGKYPGERETSVAIDFEQACLRWSLWCDGDGSTSSRPKWRYGSFYPLGMRMRIGDEEVIEERDVVVPMPERSYKAKAKLTRARWGFTKLPAFFHATLLMPEIEMHKGEQIPMPGKGENAWDCGDDATFGICAAAKPFATIEDGIGALVASVLHDRWRRSGTHGWK